jgi:uncharacterized membrane protein YhfC
MTNNNQPTRHRTIPLRYALLLCMVLLFLTGCSAQNSSVPMNFRWASVEGSQVQEKQAGEQFYFNILVDDGIIAESVPLKIKVSGNLKSGSLHFELRRPDGQVVWDSANIGIGDFSISTEYVLPAGQTGTYTLGLVYDDNTAATYNLGWHALKLGPVILLPGLGMILVSLAFVTYAALRHWLSWRYLGLGALFWVLTVAIKFAFAIPVNPLVFQALGVTRDNLFSPGNLMAYFYIGALTGIFEAGLTWVILRKIRWGKADWSQARVFGIGFGVVEAFLLGLVALASALAGVFIPDTLPVSTLGSLANNTNIIMGLAPVIERLSVIFAHIFSCVLIFHAISSRETKWGWLAILYKTLLDAPGGFAAFWGAGTVVKIWSLEAIIAVFGLIGLWGTIQIARRYPQALMDQSSLNLLP